MLSSFYTCFHGDGNIFQELCLCLSGGGWWVSVSAANLQKHFPLIKQPARQEKLIPAQWGADRRVVFMEQQSYNDSTLRRTAGTLWRSDSSRWWTDINTPQQHRDSLMTVREISPEVQHVPDLSFTSELLVSSLSSSQLIVSRLCTRSCLLNYWSEVVTDRF